MTSFEESEFVMGTLRSNTLRELLRHCGKIVRTWGPWLLVLALLYLLVTIINPRELWASAGGIRWVYCLPIAGAFLLYLLLRAVRWHLLLRPLRVPNSLLDSLLLFTGAQAATLVPAGQFLLPVLQKSQHGTLIRRSAATVLVQELIFGLLLIPAALPDVPMYHQAGWFLLASFLLSFLVGVALLQEKVAGAGLRLVRKVPLLRRFAPELTELRAQVVVARTSQAVLGSALELASIAAMGTALYLALLALGTSVGWIGAMAIYAFGASIGMLSALPGGLGVNEDVSVFLLTRMGLTVGPAVVATLLFRAETLLLGTLAGWGVLIFFRRRFRIHPSLRGLLEAVQRGETELETPRESPVPDEGPLDEPAREEELKRLERHREGEHAC